MTSETAAVIAGLAAGTVLVVLFSAAIRPSVTASDEVVLQKVRNLPEAQAFTAKYPRAYEELTRDGTEAIVKYTANRTWGYGDLDPETVDLVITKTLQLTVTFDRIGRTHLILECLGPISGSVIPTPENIRYSTCLLPSSDDLVGQGKQ